MATDTLSVVFTSSTKTVCSNKDGDSILVNPAWFATLTDIQKAMAIVHEVNHLLARESTPLRQSCPICN